MTENRKVPFREKLENYWYHHKWPTLIGAFFAVVAVVFVVQLATKVKPDANLLYVGPASISYTSLDRLQDSFRQIMREDYNRDGKKIVDYVELTIVTSSGEEEEERLEIYYSYNPEVQKTAQERFHAELAAGDSMIYLMEESYYNTALEMEILMPLEEALGYQPTAARDEYSIRLGDLEVSECAGLASLPAETILCIRYPVSLLKSRSGTSSREASNLNVFRDMIEFTLPKDPNEEEPEEEPEKNAAPQPSARVTKDEFMVLFEEYCAQNNSAAFSSFRREDCRDITTDEIFKATGATLFKYDYETYLIYDRQLYPIAMGFGGWGLTDIVTCDFDQDGVFDLLYTYSWGSGLHRANLALFRFPAMREEVLDFIHMNADALLAKESDTVVRVYDARIESADNASHQLPPLREGDGGLLAEVTAENKKPRLQLFQK